MKRKIRQNFIRRIFQSILVLWVLYFASFTSHAEPEAVEPQDAGEEAADGDDRSDESKDGELFTLCESYEEAEAIAAQYGLRLLSYEHFVAIFAVPKMSAEDFLASYEGTTELAPNHRRSLSTESHAAATEVFSEALPSSAASSGSSIALTEAAAWEDWYVSGSGGDLFLNPNSPSYQWMHDRVNSYAAWSVGRGSEEITVAVLGSGVDETQKDFVDASTAQSRIAAESVGELKSTDADGSGTHVAGVIAAGLWNGRSAVGIAPGVRILGIRVAEDDKTVGSAQLCAGILSVLNEDGSRRADILDIAVMSGDYAVKQEADAIAKVIAAGVTVIAGAGDAGSNALSYPAAYPDVISVGAVDRDGSLAGFSNHGMAVDLYAPGVKIASTEPKDLYALRSSTNDAAGVVAGAAALYMSVAGHVSPQDMWQRLADCTDEAGIVDVSALFRNDRTAPSFSLHDGLGRELAKSDGDATLSMPYTLCGDYLLSIDAAQFNEHTEHVRLVYSTNGKAPKLQDGKLSNATLYEGPLCLSDLCGSAKKKKLTIKAAAISGMGVMSEVSSFVCEVEPGVSSSEGSLRIVSAPKELPGGSSITLSAKAEGTIRSAVSWEIVDDGGLSVQINEKGRLTVGLGLSTTVKLRCYARYPLPVYSETISIKVYADRYAVKKIALNSKKGSIGYISDGSVADNYELRVVELIDRAGQNILSSGQTMLVWSSSNEKVATVEVSEDGRSAWVKPQGKGNAKIRCTAMDGSGKSAVFSCSVTQLIEAFGIEGAMRVIPGKSYKYKLSSVSPENASNKKLSWSLKDAPEGVTIHPLSGVLHLSDSTKAYAGNRFYVVATSLDKGGKTAQLELRIATSRANVDSFTLSTARSNPYLKLTRNKNTQSLSSFTLFTGKLYDFDDTTSLILNASVSSGGAELGSYPVQWKSSNEKVLSVSANGQSATLKAFAKGSATISCILADGSGKKVSAKVNVCVPVSSLSVSGQSVVPLGTSAKYKAVELLPAQASKKAVLWSVSSESGDLNGIRIDSGSGKLTVTKEATAGNRLRIYARAADQCGAYGQMSVYVSAQKTPVLKFSCSATSEVYRLHKDSETGSLSSLRLFSQDLPATAINESSIYVLTNAPSALAWSSSDEHVATVSSMPDGSSAQITATGAGNATIVCTALDGTKRSARLSVHVSVPASSLSLIPQDGQGGEWHYLACGGSVDTVAVCGSAYGTPENGDVSWTWDIVDVSPVYVNGSLSSFTISTNAYSDILPADKLVSFSSGSLTVAKRQVFMNNKAYLGGSDIENYICGVRLTAVTKDGSAMRAQQLYIIVPESESIWLYDSAGELAETENLTLSLTGGTKSFYVLRQTGTSQGYLALPGGVRVSSSAPEVVSVRYDEENNALLLCPHASGSAKIYIESRDGSGVQKQLSCQVMR